MSQSRGRAAEFLAEQVLLGRSPRTIAAQRADLDDFFAFCRGRHISPLSAGPVHIATYVADLRTRPQCATGRPRVGKGLATATQRRRLSSVRSWYAHLVFEGVRPRNPVRASAYRRRGAGRQRGGDGRRALVPVEERVPWIPTQAEWTLVLRAAQARGLRTLAMLLTQYDGALRREELVRLRIENVLPLADRAVRVPRVKGGIARTVYVGGATANVLARYIDVRFEQAKSPSEPLFVSEGPRNRGGGLGPASWSKTVEALRAETGLKGLSTHSMRHMRLTHLAGAGWTLGELAEYAGHVKLETTRIYVQMQDSGVREKYARTTATIDAWIARVVTSPKPA